MNKCGRKTCTNEQYCDKTNPSSPICADCPGIKSFYCVCGSAKNCAECNDSQDRCQTCLKGYNDEDIEQTCVKNCVDSDCTGRTYCDPVGSCKICKNQCATCKGGADKCTTCSIGYYETGDTCSKCQANQEKACTCGTYQFCATCGVSKCETCIKGYSKQGFSDDCTKTQIDCPSAGCPNGEYCNEGKCSVCKSGISTPCTCGGSAENLCATCTDPAAITCATCVKNSISTPNSDGTCKKPVCTADSCGQKKYCDMTDKTCKACNSKCQTCNEADKCLTCAKPGFADPDCNSCQNDFIMNSELNCTQCTKGQTRKCNCGSLNNCTTCDVTDPKNLKCKSCLVGHSGEKCNICVDGYFMDGTTCSKCPAGCSKCSSNNVCTTCENNYIMSSGSCNLCKHDQTEICTCGDIKDCSTCDISTPANPKCKTCFSGHYLADSCKKCDNTAPKGVCTSCADGFELTTEQLCQAKCDNLGDGKVCVDGKQLDCGAEGQLTECKCGTAENCFDCDGDKCKSCMPGHSIVSGVCSSNCQKGYSKIGDVCILDAVKTGLSGGAIAGIVIGVVILGSLIGGGIFFYLKKVKSSKKDSQDKMSGNAQEMKILQTSNFP